MGGAVARRWEVTATPRCAVEAEGMDVDVVEDAAGRGDGETRRSCCLHGGRPPRRDAGSNAERRRHERGADDVRHRLSCAALVRRSTSGRRAGGGGVGANRARSSGSCLGTQAVYCAVPRAVGATRGPAPTRHRRRSFSSTSSGSATCAARGHGEKLAWAGTRSRWAVF